MKFFLSWLDKQASWWGSRSLVWWAGHLTAIYIGLVILVMASRFDELLALPLNSLGDFSAGAFGPVAFLWLVLGYKLQGDELKASSTALEAQVSELKNSINLQRINAEKQDLMIDPVFYLNPVESNFIDGQVVDRLSLINKGETCRDVYVAVRMGDGSACPGVAGSHVHVLPKDTQFTFNVGQVSHDQMIAIVITYERLNGSKSMKGFNYFKPKIGEPRTFAFLAG